MIEGREICFSYAYSGSADILKNINISLKKGEHVAILGCNGSGKSTLVKHLNALLKLQHGTLRVAHIDVSDEKQIWKLRRMCGMVFQNPNNQFVSSVIADDIAFGLENYEVPREEIPAKVAYALKLAELEGYGKRAPNTLSGGQKQRAALAGVLALEPEMIILDEATAMLDPAGRKEVINIVKKLHRAGRTIITITHYVEEAVTADRVLLMKDGKILADGTAEDILTDCALLEAAGLLPPMPVRVYYDLQKQGICLNKCPLTDEELCEEICRYR